ncbi:MAG: biotin--[acetyl-CoA-carboxylase] ligase, partial [Lacticaseibacillus paracasei]|nr:biotin--[acetyl-CoA-carboxylase] ligase [Lacticaseibacillus paracasei]
MLALTVIKTSERKQFMFEPDALNPWLDDPRLRAAVT